MSTKILALDISPRRVGIAVGDLALNSAKPLKTFARAKGFAEKEIVRIVREQGIGTIVAGLPLSSKGDRTPQCDEVENFCRRLLKRVEVELQYVDEHLTTEEARSRIADTKGYGVTDEDAVAAAVILEDYLNSRSQMKIE